jgi:cell division protein FtsQ
MPRISASTAVRPPISAVTPRPSPRPRAKKTAVPQDRLTSRTLFWRRVKRSLRPGLWLLGIFAVLVVVSEFIRALPSATPVAAPARPAPAAQEHHGSGLASLVAHFGLRVSKVEIIGAQATDPAALRDAIGVQPGEPSFGFSLSAVQQRVEALGPVQSATVRRVLPGTLIVTVTERAAYAIWQTTGPNGATKFLLIDRNGNVITDQDAAAAKRREPWLLLLAGADAPANAQTLMNEFTSAPAVLAHVAAAQRVDGLRWNLILKNQTVVKLPETGEQEAINQLAALQKSMQLLDRPVEVIDLRLAGKLVVRPYPAPAPAKGAKS